MSDTYVVAEAQILSRFRQVDTAYGKGTPLLVEDFRLGTDLRDVQIRRVLARMVKSGKLTCSKWDRRNAYLVKETGKN